MSNLDRQRDAIDRVTATVDIRAIQRTKLCITKRARSIFSNKQELKTLD
jgi:hypothetical protein